MAWHAVNPLGDSASHEHLRLVLVVRPNLQRTELGFCSYRYGPSELAWRPFLGAVFCHSGQCLVRRTILFDYVFGGPEVSA